MGEIQEFWYFLALSLTKREQHNLIFVSKSDGICPKFSFRKKKIKFYKIQ
jgi:hypothetical protein